MKAQLTLIPGGRNQPEVVVVERGVVEELAVELTVSKGERVVYASRAVEQWTQVLLALGQVQPNTDRAEEVAVAALRLARQERQRAMSAIAPDPTPAVALGRAA